MKKIMLILIVLLYANLYAQVWETQNSGVKNTLNSVCFIDTLNGWAVGDSATILKTSDGGKNWLKQASQAMTTDLYKVQFVSINVGFILARNGLFLTTQDGGVNWYTSYVKTDSSGVTYTDVCFVNEKEGWMTGKKAGINYGFGLILHTSDGGKTWKKQLELLSYDQFNVKFFSAVAFKDNKTGWALAGDYFDNFSWTSVYKTENGGSTWENIGLIQEPEIKLHIAGKDTLWAGDLIFVTSFDSGRNWIYFFTDLNLAMLVSPVSGLVGWIYNYDFNTDGKRILFTNNAGKTWKEELKWSGGPFVTDITNEEGYLWIVGTDGMIKRRNPTVTSVGKEKDELPKEFRLYPNYPNPFNSDTTISYDLISESNVELNIYDATGKKIRSFNYGSQSGGKHRTIWDGTNNLGKYVSNGVYVCNVKAISTSGKIISIYAKMVFLK